MCMKWASKLIIVITLSLATPAGAQDEPNWMVARAAINPVFLVPPGLSPKLPSYLENVQGSRVHVLVRFNALPVPWQRYELAREFRTTVLDYLGDHVYVISAPKDLEILRAIQLRRDLGITGITPLDPKGKLEPRLAGGSLPKYSKRSAGFAQFLVSFFRDVDERAQHRLLTNYGAEETGFLAPINTRVVMMHPRVIERLSREDAIRSIEAGPPAPTDDNDGARGETGALVDPILAGPYSLSGQGVVIAQWESRNAQSEHTDFDTRLEIADPPVPWSDRTHAHAESSPANGLYDSGEGIYVDMDDSRKVSVGDRRSIPVTITVDGVSEEFPAGSVGTGDGDLGTPLVSFKPPYADRPEAYWERRDPAGTLSEQEAVYRGEGLCSGCSGCYEHYMRCCVKPGAERLIGMGESFPVGTVSDNDLDIGKCLHSLASEPHAHATHVAGTMIGSGLQGSTLQYMGMAPKAKILSFRAKGGSEDFQAECMLADGTVLSDEDCWLPQDFDKAIAGGATIVNNSWGFYYYSREGYYNLHSQLYDAVASGRNSDGLYWNEERPALLLVGSSGNFRYYRNSDGDWQYWENIRVANGAKNTVMVGAVTSDTNMPSSMTAFGPTGEGRLKPDLVAPGDQEGGDGGITSTVPGSGSPSDCGGGTAVVGTSGYGTKCGSSMATPVVSGVAALLTHRYRKLCRLEGDPPPELIKALLLHTARDLVDAPTSPAIPEIDEPLTGPDFVYGFGLVQAADAAEILTRHRTGQIDYAEELGSWPGMEGVEQFPEPVEFKIDVEEGQTIKVTLAWNDPASAVYYGVTGGTLINDLDLRVIDPEGTVHHPRFPDPANPGQPAATGVDTRNTVEQVYLEDATAGVWLIRVQSKSLAQPPQAFAVVSESLTEAGTSCWIPAWPASIFHDWPHWLNRLILEQIREIRPEDGYPLEPGLVEVLPPGRRMPTTQGSRRNSAKVI